MRNRYSRQPVHRYAQTDYLTNLQDIHALTHEAFDLIESNFPTDRGRPVAVSQLFDLLATIEALSDVGY